MGPETSSTREIMAIVLGVDHADEYALLETVCGSREQFVVSRQVAGEAWPVLEEGLHVRAQVSVGRLGRVKKILEAPAPKGD